MQVQPPLFFNDQFLSKLESLAHPEKTVANFERLTVRTV